jgi:hypothetical protein
MAALVTIVGEPDTVKKHVASRLVNRGLAAWVQRGISIRRLTDRQRTLRSYCKKHASGFVPEKLPLAELPGIKFELPERPPKFPFPVFEDLPAIQD